jgi:hypothetical protein
MAKRQNGVSEYALVRDEMTWTFGGNVAAVTYNLGNIPEWNSLCEFTKTMLRNGAKQKIADSMAIQGASVAEKAAAARETALNLTQLIWRGDRGSLLASALQLMYPHRTAQEIADYMRGLDDEEIKNLKKDSRVVEAMNKVRAERVSPETVEAVDVILAGLE